MATLNLTTSANSSDTHAASGANNAGKRPPLGTVSDAALLQPGSHGGNNEYSAAVRFTGVTIAQAATITSALFSLRANSTYNASPNVVKLIVCCEAADNAGALATSGATDLDGATRPGTTADATWTVTTVTGGTRYSVDITAAVQEVINRAGWVSGNAIVVLIDTHADTSLSEWQDFDAHNTAGSTNGPRLDIDYSAGGAFTGTAAGGLPALTAAGAGTFTAPTYTGSGAVNLPALTVAGTGAHTAPTYTGTAAIILPALTASGTGTQTTEYIGAGAAPLPALTAAGTGTHTAPTYTGSAALTLPALTASGTGTQSTEYTGDGAATVPALTASGTGAHTAPTYTGSATPTLPAITAEGVGIFASAVYSGSGGLVLPLLTVAGSGTVTAPTYSGAGALTLPLLTLAGVGTASGPLYTGSGAAALGALTASGAGVFTEDGFDPIANPAATWGDGRGAAWSDDGTGAVWGGEKRGAWGT